MPTPTPYEQSIIQKAREGDYDAFTEHFFRLPYSGTWYTPEDRVEQWNVLHQIWRASGQPESDLRFTAGKADAHYKVVLGQYDQPAFLEPHGYRFLPWFRESILATPDIFVALGGTGSAKTCSVGIFFLMMMALEPGFNAINVAPTAKQAGDMLREIEKWVTQSRYVDFVVRPRSKKLFLDNNGVLELRVDFGEAESLFSCHTIGDKADIVLGSEADCVSVDEAGLAGPISIPKLITRIRGSRITGIPRHCKPALLLLSNPHDNPSFDALCETAEKEMRNPTQTVSYRYAQPSEDDNIYITARQRRLHTGMMGEAEQARWLKGSRQVFLARGIITRAMMERCHDKAMDTLLPKLAKHGYPYVQSDHMGILHYETPQQVGHDYMVLGDPGTADLQRLDDNNIPVVLVLDTTGLAIQPAQPAILTALWIGSGSGHWDSWIEKFLQYWDQYDCFTGGYDATSNQRMLSEFGPVANLPLIWPVTMSGGNKITSRMMFQLMADAGLFRWPYIERLWREAKEYKESGVGKRAIPDDVLSALFVGAFVIRGTYYDQLAKMLEEDNEEEEQSAEEIMDDWTTSSRYSRTGRNRYQRASVGPPQDDLEEGLY